MVPAYSQRSLPCFIRRPSRAHREAAVFTAVLVAAMSALNGQTQADMPKAPEPILPRITPAPTRVARKAIPHGAPPVARLPLRENPSQQCLGQQSSSSLSSLGGIASVDGVAKEEITSPNISHCGACKCGELSILHHSVSKAEHDRSISNDPRNLVPHLQFGE